jgi:hypothetical protein
LELTFMSTSKPTTYQRSATLLEAEVGDELVALQLESGACFSFDPVAKEIWELLVQPRTIQAMCDQLLLTFEVDRERCEREVAKLVAELEAMELVTASGGP